jgi:hypothetical protein
MTAILGALSLNMFVAMFFAPTIHPDLPLINAGHPAHEDHEF